MSGPAPLSFRDPLPPPGRALPAAALVVAGLLLIGLGITEPRRRLVAFLFAPLVLCLGLLRFVGRRCVIERDDGPASPSTEMEFGPGNGTSENGTSGSGTRRILRMRIGPFGMGPASRQDLEGVRELRLHRSVSSGGSLATRHLLCMAWSDGRELVVHAHHEAAPCRALATRLAAELHLPLREGDALEDGDASR